MPRQKHTCTPGPDCFECPWPDCRYGERGTELERQMKRRSNIAIGKINNGNYSPVEVSIPVRYGIGGGECKTVKASSAEIERMLAERWPGRIEPIRHALPVKFKAK